MSKENFGRRSMRMRGALLTDAMSDDQRRAAVSGINRTKVLDFTDHLFRRGADRRVHPLQFGFFRRKLPHAAAPRHADPHPARVLSVARVRLSESDVAMAAARLALSPYHGRASRRTPPPVTHFERSIAAAYRRGRKPIISSKVFADKIPHTHGAPVRAPAAVAAAE